MFTKIFIPLFFVTFFLANYTLAQGGMLLPSTWPVIKNDTIIDGWQIRYLPEPQGTVGWQWSYTTTGNRTKTNYLFNKNGKCVWASLFLLPEKPGGITSILDATCPAAPPIPFEKTGLQE
ncbi:MAG: hypothetical protein ACK4FA_00415 [Candidatus Paceibacteria bacterium]